MNILADESVDGPLVQALRQAGHRVDYVAEMSAGVSDEQVLRLANQQAAILLTADTDFGEMVFRQRQTSGGLVLLRLSGLSRKFKADIVVDAIQSHSTEIPGGFVVIAPGQMRIRRLT